MQRIPTLLQKLTELSKTDGDKLSVIDLDLMLDYTRVLYADLLEWKKRTQFSESLAEPASTESQIHSSEPEAPPMPTSTAPSVDLSNQVQHYDLPAENLQTDETSSDIRKQVGINDKYQFISELFGNDKEAYEQVINNVNRFDKYDDAIEWLDEHAHTKYAWKDEDSAVQSFYDAVSKFFASR